MTRTHIGLAVYDWDGLIGYTARPVSKSAHASWLKKDGFYANGDSRSIKAEREDAERLFAVYGREQSAPVPTAKRVTQGQEETGETWHCHYCGMPASSLDFFGAPVCDDCSH